MRQTLLTILLLLVLVPTPGIPVAAQGNDPAEVEPVSGSVVCPPGVYPSAPSDCLPIGPSEYMTHVASENIPYPILPLPAYSPDASLAEIPYQYFKLTQADARFYLFPTLDAAMASSVSGQSLGPGEVIVSYVDRIENNSGVFYQLRSGYWVRGDFGGRLAMHQPFLGLLFSSQPHNPFGWVLGPIVSRSAAGVNSPETGHSFNRYNIVQIYATQTVDNMVWNLVAPDEWLDARQVARVDPVTLPPKGITTNRWIEVNLEEQTLSVYQDNRLVFATLVSSGIENLWTRPGIFQIQEKKLSEDMSGSTAADGSDLYHVEDVPWTMYFDEKRALHGAYWHDRFGYPNSHGCVNLSLGDSHWLYDWASVGDFVYVHDPSGHTPTDAALFGSGAPCRLKIPMVYSARSWTRGVAAKHAALSRPRSRVRISSGPWQEELV